ncbi:MAG: hypothetical protein ACD_43C00129G0001, partial [uncultured bacterium]
WLLTILYIPRIGDSILILHYNIYLGPDVFGNWYELLMLPGLGFVVTLINLGLGFWLLRRELFLAKLIAITSIPVQLVLGSALWLILSINRLV